MYLNLNSIFSLSKYFLIRDHYENKIFIRSISSNIFPQQTAAQNISVQGAVYNKIAFTRSQTQSDWDIWIMNADGSSQTKLLDSDSKDMNPYFRPDGKYIAFTLSSGSAPNLVIDTYVMNSNGTNVRNLSEDVTESCVGPKFSWDGSKIVFFRNKTGTG
jgi:Tol biopolymer transport system component